MHLTKTSRLAATVAAMSVVMTVALAGCGSDDDSSSSTTESAAGTAVMGTPNKAEGTPVLIGFIGNGLTDQGDSTDETRGANAAAGYANEYLGGINGHPIVIKNCDSGVTPTGGTDCANQLVQEKVAAIVLGGTQVVDAVVETASKAGIPAFSNESGSLKVLQTAGAFSFGNALATFGIGATQAQDVGAKGAAIVVSSIPASEGAAKNIGNLVYGNAKIPMDIVSIPVGTPDMTPQIATAIKNGAEQFLVLGNDAFCIGTLKAIRTLEPDAPITMNERCIQPGAEGSIPNGYKGITVATTGNYDTTTPDGQIFAAALNTYGDNAKPGAKAGYGYMPTLALIQALNASQVTDLIPANIVAGAKAAPALPYPLGSGKMYQCNGQQVPTSANVCSTDGLAGTADSNGTLSDVKVVKIDPKLFTPAAS